MKDNGKIILALLAGASAGVVAGLLMAPETGETTRGNIKSSASKLSKGLEGKLQASMDQLQSLGTSAGSLLGKVGLGGASASDAPVAASTATSHLDNNPTGGNVSSDLSSDLGNTGGTNSAPVSSGKKSKGATGEVSKKATATKAEKGKAGSGKGSSKGSGGGSNATV